jgi:hypothetical protein
MGNKQRGGNCVGSGEGRLAGSKGCVKGAVSVRGGEKMQGYRAKVDPVAKGQNWRACINHRNLVALWIWHHVQEVSWGSRWEASMSCCGKNQPLLDIPCYLLVDPHHTQHNSPLSAYFLYGHTPSVPVSCTAGASTSGSVCSQLLTLAHRLRIIPPWRWRRYVPPKRRSTQVLHSATSQKTTFF